MNGAGEKAAGRRFYVGVGVDAVEHRGAQIADGLATGHLLDGSPLDRIGFQIESDVPAGLAVDLLTGLFFGGHERPLAQKR